VSRGQYDSQERAVGIVRLLLGHGANANAKDKGHMTPLHLACYYGKLEIARILLSHSASANTKCERGQAALHLVLDGNRSGPDGVGITRLLLENGADVNANDGSQETPLHLASKYGMFAIGRVLLIHGANANAVNIRGQTPLHTLSLRPYGKIGNGDELRLVGVLVDGGADIDARDKDNETPLEMARFDIAESLKEYVPRW
jgi:ankyrin repeat protein